MHSDGNNNHRAIIEGTISGVVVLVIIVVAIYSKDRKKRGLPLIPPILTSCWRQRIPQPSPLTFDLQQPSYPQQVLQFNSQSSREPETIFSYYTPTQPTTANYQPSAPSFSQAPPPSYDRHDKFPTKVKPLKDDSDLPPPYEPPSASSVYNYAQPSQPPVGFVLNP